MLMTPKIKKRRKILICLRASRRMSRRRLYGKLSGQPAGCCVSMSPTLLVLGTTVAVIFSAQQLCCHEMKIHDNRIFVNDTGRCDTEKGKVEGSVMLSPTSERYQYPPFCSLQGKVRHLNSARAGLLSAVGKLQVSLPNRSKRTMEPTMKKHNFVATHI